VSVLLLSSPICIACAPLAPSIVSPTSDGGSRATPLWADEFDGDLSRWYSDLSANEWIPGQGQAITDRPENAYIDDGELVIELRREDWVDSFGNEKEYTSSRLVTDDAFLYGRFEARLKAPVGAGFWSAFWLLGVGPWPAGGELDVVELLGDTEDAYVAAHGVSRNGAAWDKSTSVQTADGAPWGASWHVYAVEWTPEAVVFEIDGEEVMRFTPEDVESDGTFWSFDEPEQIIFSLALGAWEGFPGGGQPDETTSFPGELRVDWVRVYDSEVFEDVPRG